MGYKGFPHHLWFIKAPMIFLTWGMEARGFQAPTTDPSLRITGRGSWHPQKGGTAPFSPTVVGSENLYPPLQQGSGGRVDPRQTPPISPTVHPMSRMPMAETALRNVYLNGVNIGSVKNESFENVHVKIDGAGHIHITGRHYEAVVESVYNPFLPNPQGLTRSPQTGVEGQAKNDYASRVNQQEGKPQPPVPPASPAAPQPAAPTGAEKEQ